MKKTLFEQEISNIAKNAGYGGIGILISYVIAYFSSAIVTRVIGADSYGIFLLASSALSIASLFAMLGLGPGVLRYVSLYAGKNDLPRIKGSIIFSIRVTLVASLLVVVVAFWFAPLLSKEIFHKSNLTIALKILTVGLPFSAIAGICLASLQGLKLIKLNVFLSMIFRPLSRLVFLVVLFLFGFKLLGVLWAAVLSSIFTCALAFLYLKKNCHSFDRKITAIFESRQIINFSAPLFFESFLNTMIGTIDILMLGYFASSSDVGIYGIALKLGLMVVLPLTAFNMIFAPTISNLHGRNEKETLEKLFKTVTKWIFTLSFAVFLAIVLFAKPILNIFGQDFVAGASALLILSFGRLVDAGVGSAGYIIMMTGRPKINLLNSSLLCVITVIMNLLLIPRYGIIGAAIGTAFSITVINIMRLLEVYYFERIHPYQKSFVKPLASGILAALIVYILGQFFPYDHNIFLSFAFGILFFAAYAGLLQLFILDDEDRYILTLVGRRLKFVSRCNTGN